MGNFEGENFCEFVDLCSGTKAFSVNYGAHGAHGRGVARNTGQAFFGAGVISPSVDRSTPITVQHILAQVLSDKLIATKP